jgi:hypothetical protein
VDCEPVLECYYPQAATLELRDLHPEPKPIVLLGLDPDRLLHCPYTPLLLQVRALTKNPLLEVAGEPVLGHGSKDTAAAGDVLGWLTPQLSCKRII